MNKRKPKSKYKIGDHVIGTNAHYNRINKTYGEIISIIPSKGIFNKKRGYIYVVRDGLEEDHKIRESRLEIDIQVTREKRLKQLLK